jgi:hypothetical protein
MGATSFAKVGTAAAGRCWPAAETDATSAAAKTPETPAAKPATTVDWMRMDGDCNVWGQ